MTLTDERLRWPEKLTLRDTKVFADEGQRIFTTATGYGYEKQEYIRADLAHRTNGGQEALDEFSELWRDMDKSHDVPTEFLMRLSDLMDAYLSPVSIPQAGTSGVRVKALEWDGNRAETPVGIYYVSRIGADWTVERGHTHAGDFYALKTGRATDFDAALVEGKAVAQLDCETRILAALEPSP